MLFSAVQLKTDSSCIAIFKSFVPYLSKKHSNKFQNNVLVLVNKELLNQKVKNWQKCCTLPGRMAGVQCTPVLGAQPTWVYSVHIKGLDFS